MLGPTTKSIKVHSWKIQCPQTLKHYLWQIISGCLPVRINLTNQGKSVTLSGIDEELRRKQLIICCSNVHHLYKVWALSKIPSNPWRFPMQSVFCIKVFNGFKNDPRDTLHIPEALLWKEAQVDKKISGRQVLPLMDEESQSSLLIIWRWCFTDASWKDKDLFSGQGCYSILEGFDGLMVWWWQWTLEPISHLYMKK